MFPEVCPEGTPRFGHERARVPAGSKSTGGAKKASMRGRLVPLLPVKPSSNRPKPMRIKKAEGPAPRGGLGRMRRAEGPPPEPTVDRRTLLVASVAGGSLLATGGLLLRCGCCPTTSHLPTASSDRPPVDAPDAGERSQNDRLSDPPIEPLSDPEDVARRRAIEKARDFDSSFHDDVVVIDERMALLRRVHQRVERAQRTVGHGHFGLYGFDDLLNAGQRFSKIGAFTRDETDFLDELFAVDAADYGFFGDKVIRDLTFRHPRREVYRIRGTGHYLLRGAPLDLFEQMRADVDSVVLTSGVRGLAKQIQLFLAKVVASEGNMSRAARSLAPPGYSHHASGDFDIGAAALGGENFTEEFARTDEFKRLMDLGYVSIRYDQSNALGVRHEPWHVRVS